MQLNLQILKFMARYFCIWAFSILFLVLDYGCFGCFDEERTALLELKTSFGSPVYSSLSSWEDEVSDCCGWERVECSNTTGRVLKLFLNNTRNSSDEAIYLNASLFLPFVELKVLNLSTNMLVSDDDDNEGSARLSKLNNLELLDLSNNSLDSSVLTSLTELSSLRSLFLGTNILAGSTEELAALHNMEVLDLSNNELESFITTKGLKNLKKLQVLNLKGNSFNISTLKSLGMLLSLKELYLANNYLGGSVTLKEMNSLRNLEVLDLSSTNISSGILEIVELMISLKALSLRGNGINDSMQVVQGLCRLKSLQELDLSGNNLESSVPPCFGNLTSLRVLDLSKNRFSGNLHSSLFAGLKSLEFLSLSNNVFQTFPPLSSFAQHSKLQVLDMICENNTLVLENEDQSWIPSFQLKVFRLSSCILKTKSIPSLLYHQYDLRVVDLSHNNLKGDFPTWLMKNNTRLEDLQLKNNSLTRNFRLPDRPNVFVSAIDISNNFLQGQMPSNISVSLPNLKFLNASWNSFNGRIPSSFGSMENLLFLDLSNNSFVGGIPEEIAMGCPSLEYLILSQNYLHGQMFPSFSDLPKLKYLLLGDNHLSGKIPDLSNSSMLERLDISGNSISGELPGWIGKLTNLDALVMPHNKLEGSIPVEFCLLEVLTILDLSDNKLSGSLPSCFSPSSLIHVHLQGNHLSGPLTKAFTSSKDLATLDLRHNNLSGVIPDWISQLSGLSILLLKGNHFQGKIPSGLCQLSKITILDLSHNNLSGHIPSCLNKIRFRIGFRSGKFYIISYFQSPEFSSYLYQSQCIELSQVNLNSHRIAGDKAVAEFTSKNRTDFYKGNFLYSMTGIDLSSNKLTGGIPPEIGELSLIRALDLSHNSLTGPIPAAFSGLKNIESLNLSYNNLTGPLPGELTKLTSLAVFTVAHNNLTGEIPNGNQFGTFLEDSYVGNPYLCGLVLRKNCSRGDEEKDSEGQEGGNDLTEKGVFFLSFGVSYVAALAGLAAILFINRDWRKKWFHAIDVLIRYCCNFVTRLVDRDKNAMEEKGMEVDDMEVVMDAEYAELPPYEAVKGNSKKKKSRKVVVKKLLDKAVVEPVDKEVVGEDVGVVEDREVALETAEEGEVDSEIVKEEQVVTVTRPVKLVFKEDIRWAQLPANCSIRLERDIVQDRFPSLKGVLVKYRDHEGDLVTITTDDELRIVEESGGPKGSLKLYVAEVSPDYEPRYEAMDNGEEVYNHDKKATQVKENGTVEKVEDVEHGFSCIDDWIVQFARLFKNYVGFDSDSYLDLHELGMKLYSEAMEDAVTSEEAQELFEIAADKFQEMAALALFNWGNVHMSMARKSMFITEDGSRESVLTQIKTAYEWAQKEYLKASLRYEEALKIKPDFYEGHLALGQQQFEQAKLCWYYAIACKIDLESGPSVEVLQLYNKAEDSMERGMLMWEEMEEQRLNGLSKLDKYQAQLQKMGLDAPFKDTSATETAAQAANMRSQVYLLWGTLLYERSIVEFKLGLLSWEECLEVAVEKFELAGASPTDIAVMIKNHCSNGAALEGLGFNINEIVQAWNEMYDAKRWQIGVPSFRLEPLFRRQVPKLHHILEHI